MAYYEVLIKAYCSVLVEAEDEDQALEFACEDAGFGDFEMDEASIEREVSEEMLSSAKRLVEVCSVK